MRTTLRSLERPPAARDYLMALTEGCSRALAGGSSNGMHYLHQLVLRFIDQRTPNSELLAHLVAEALLQRFDNGLMSSRNVYVQALEPTQTDLFYLAARAVPFVGQGHAAANQFLAIALRGKRHGVVIELGAGHGIQLAALVRELAGSPQPPASLHIYGVDPVEANLRSAQRRVEHEARETPFTVAFTPVPEMIEDLDVNDIDRPDPSEHDGLVINSAFTFHHVRAGAAGEDVRADVLRRLARLRPDVLTLVEPNVNHHTSGVLARLHNSWEHFGAVFELVDQSSLALRDKLAVKAHFFGREIRDIFSVDDRYRCERHEPYHAWREHLRMAGLDPVPADGLAIDLPERCSYEVDPGLVRFSYAGQTLVAVLAHRAVDNRAVQRGQAS